MDESMTAQSLVLQANEVARMQQCNKVVAVKIRVGARTGLSTDYLRQLFIAQAQGTVAEGARLEISVRQDAEEPRAQEVIVEDVETVC